MWSLLGVWLTAERAYELRSGVVDQEAPEAHLLADVSYLNSFCCI